jgi:PhnB protein
MHLRPASFERTLFEEFTMSIFTTPHLNRSGDARAALEFYHSVFAGDLRLVTYQDLGNAETPDMADKIVWGQVVSADGFRVMAYDVPPSRKLDSGVAPFYLVISCENQTEATTYWDRLSVQGTVLAPLEPARWAPLYGMLTDRYGVTWIIDVIAAH